MPDKPGKGLILDFVGIGRIDDTGRYGRAVAGQDRLFFGALIAGTITWAVLLWVALA